MTVEEMKRRDAYERSQAAKRIQEETERSRQLLMQRKELQDQRRLANMQASFQRQQIVEASARGRFLGVGREQGCLAAAASRHYVGRMVRECGHMKCRDRGIWGPGKHGPATAGLKAPADIGRVTPAFSPL